MITIYHNPKCGTSRNVLAEIEAAGIQPTIIRYLDTPLSKDALKQLVREMAVPVRAILRERGTPYEELDLGNAKWSDDALLDFVAAHPILLNRPIVTSPLGAKLCRPVETVHRLLPNKG